MTDQKNMPSMRLGAKRLRK